MRTHTSKSFLAATLASSAAVLLAGCSGFRGISTAPVAQQGSAFTGRVIGGQQPVKFATISFYAAATTGYGVSNQNVLTAPVSTDGGGNFNIGTNYTCTPGQQMYIVATGGDPGGGINNNLALMAALGDCASLGPQTFINMNEVTTIGTAFALAPFMSSITQLSTSANNTVGLVRAFANVNKLVSIAGGSTPGPALPTGATAPAAEIYTLADILALCVNSQGGVANDGTTNCGYLLGLTTPTGGIAPTDTIQAALNIAHNPKLNVGPLYQLATGQPPFTGKLPSAPNDWTLAVTYANGGFSTPKSTTVDAAGNIWVANAGNNSVTVLAQTGTPLAFSPLKNNGLAQPAAIAIDNSGNAWVANAGGATVSAFTGTGAALAGSPFSGSSTISAPAAIAIDAPGNIWVANKGNSSVTELNATGAYLQQVSSGVTAPNALAINPK
jgi:hypothetical protein